MRSAKDYNETNEIEIHPIRPGYLFIWVRNDHGIAKQKIALFTDTISIMTDNVWNEHLKQNELAVGEKLLLKCKVSLYSDLHWHHNMESFSWRPPPRARFGDMLGLEYTTTQEVEITDIRENGTHTFSCFGKNNSVVGPATHVEFQMIHKVAPKIASNFGRNPEKLVTKSFGDSIILKCSVEEMSIRNFSWFKDGQRLSACDNGSRTIHHGKFNISFLIEKITQDDAGVYSCKAMNLFGRDEHFFELKVRGKESAERNFISTQIHSFQMVVRVVAKTKFYVRFPLSCS